MNVFAGQPHNQYNYTTSPQDSYSMQPSLSSDGAISELSPPGGQVFAATVPSGSLSHQPQQQLYAFQRAPGTFDPLISGQAVPAGLYTPTVVGC